MCQSMTSQPLRHQGKSLIRLFSLKIRSRIGDSDVPEHEKSFRMLEQVSNTPDTSEVPEKK